MAYEIAAAGVRQKKPEIIAVVSRGERYFAVRKYGRGLNPTRATVFRSPSREACQAFIDNDCVAVKPAPKKKRTRKKKQP